MNASSLFRAAGIASFLALAAGCHDQYAAEQRLLAQMTAATKETADLLATVQDKTSAEAAAPKLQVLVDRLDEMNEEYETIDTGDELYLGKRDQRIMDQHGQWIAEHTRLMQEEYRVGQIAEAREALGQPWTQLTGGAYDPGGTFAPGGEMALGATTRPGQRLPGLPSAEGTPQPAIPSAAK